MAPDMAFVQRSADQQQRPLFFNIHRLDVIQKEGTLSDTSVLRIRRGIARTSLVNEIANLKPTQLLFLQIKAGVNMNLSEILLSLKRG